MESTDQSGDGTQVLNISAGDYSLYQPDDGTDDPLATVGDDDGATGGEDKGSMSPLREQDRFLPIANVARIMKNSIPKNGKISKEAKECVQECISEFISFITSEASERCHQEKRKTINGEDILFAMSTLGFDNYVEPLKLYLQKYRESMKGDKVLPTGVSRDGLEDLTDDFGSSPTMAPTLLTTESGQILTYTTQVHNLTQGQFLT
ncbi:uncharacterized protein [Amphiura filiformis]|uniref:uncharacterized protein isoform X2 n=1 Tax=Amphiura filiformis TaxID=82378 RepID=UPI003B224FB2